MGISNQRVRFQPEAVLPRTGPRDPPFVVTIIDDSFAEDTEYFEIPFEIQTSGYAVPRAVGRVTILDNDEGAPGMYVCIHL